MTQQLSPSEALIYAMFTTAAVDRRITEEELARIGSIIRELPAFRGYGPDWLQEEAQACGALLRKPGGIETVLDLVAEALPPNLHETVYVLAAEVAATDLKIHGDEVRFLDLLVDRLKLDRLVRTSLDRAVRARHQAA
jgi:uncharacterized membrane protein YebE (DUF533 family)